MSSIIQHYYQNLRNSMESKEEAEIDRLGYALYGLSEDEIKIVEGEIDLMKDEIQKTLDSIDIQKNVTETFKAIDEFQNTQTCVFTFSEAKKSEKGDFFKCKNKHVVRFSASCDYQEFSKRLFPSTLVINEITYHCKDSLITTISFDELPRLNYEVSLSDIYCGEKAMYYRMVLPLDKELSFIRLFDAYSFCYNKSSWSCELIKTYIEGREFHIYKLSKDNTKFLLIDCLSEIEYQDFYDQCVCILCSLGILTGYFVENESYIFSSNVLNFSSIQYKEFRSLRDSKYAQNVILPINPFAFFPKSEVEENRHLMAHIHTDVFTRLVNKTRLSLTLENSLFIFLEALSYPLDTQPACLSVVLEGLCNYVKDENESSFKPITDKGKAREIRKKMKDVLNDYEADFSMDGRQIIEKRIDDINNPTNRGKFEKAIQLLGLDLKDYEKEALLNRNTFLHCTTELKTDYIEIKQGSPDYMKLFFASQILVRLLYKMILKLIGYEGYIVNILKYNEVIFESISEEPMLIKI